MGEDGRRPTTLDHLKSRKKPVIKKVWLPDDSEIAERRDKAEDRLREVEAKLAQRDTPFLREERNAAHQEFEAATQAYKENSTLWVFQSVGRTLYDELMEGV